MIRNPLVWSPYGIWSRIGSYSLLNQSGNLPNFPDQTEGQLKQKAPQPWVCRCAARFPFLAAPVAGPLKSSSFGCRGLLRHPSTTDKATRSEQKTSDSRCLCCSHSGWQCYPSHCHYFLVIVTTYFYAMLSSMLYLLLTTLSASKTRLGPPSLGIVRQPANIFLWHWHQCAHSGDRAAIRQYRTGLNNNQSHCEISLRHYICNGCIKNVAPAYW